MELQTPEVEEKRLKPTLGIVAALSVVVGMVLGAGAFMKPPAVLAAAGDSTWALIAWGIGGLLSMAGGLTLCELAVMYPRTGGIYVFLEELYGKTTAYLFGWMLTFVFGPGTVGALVGYFSSVFCLLFYVPESYNTLVGAIVLAFILFVNSVNVKTAGYLQTVATVCKLIPIIALAVFGLWKGNGQVMAMSAGVAVTVPFSAAILATLFAYDGWAQVTSLAGELKNPGKLLPRAIIGGLCFLILIYIMINIALLKVLPAEQMVALGHNASAIAAQKLFGLYGGNLIAVGIMISIIGGMNGYCMTLSRYIMVMGERKQLPCANWFGKVEIDSGTPVNASIVVVVLALLAFKLLDADKLSNLSIFAIWIFYTLAFFGVFIARKRYPNAVRTYKVPFYPVVPAIAILGAFYIMYGMIVESPVNAVVAVLLTLLGLPVYKYITNAEPLFKKHVSKKYVVLMGAVLLLVVIGVTPHIVDTRPTLKVAVEPSTQPVAFENSRGELTGFDIDIVNAIAHRLDYRIIYVPISFENILEVVNAGKVDMAIGALTITAEREKIVNFSETYYSSGLALLVPDNGTVTSIEALRGKTVGVQDDSTSETYLKKQYPEIIVRPTDTTVGLIGLFNDGYIQAIVFDKPLLEYWLKNNMIKAGKIIDLNDTQNYGFAINKKDENLLMMVNHALDEMKQSGDISAIMDKWIKQSAK